ncbi:hypothetical protein C4B63_18g142 [Trypanosoma cruzi]|uniref:Uncharacterized protein n=1 Tax=Trypanosoma cruzi TaxID=5693 RepID=A0A2V2VR03_TRYCR|nr:hypothetical protein C4B63_18g142 [Trypanosoma cruzi]
MEAIKGLARRTTQSIREKVKNREATGHDELLEVTSKKVLQYQKSGEVICSKLIRAAGLIEELGRLMKDVGEEYQSVSDLPQESSQLATDVLDMGTKLVATAQEHQKGLKEEGFDVLNAFIKNTSKLRDAEEARRKNRLEYDFFRQKVLELRSCPPKDTSRIPRNEQKMENWRVEFWRATENHKAVCSQLYVEGQRAIDLSVLTLTKVLGSFMNIAGDGFKQQFVNARLPVYPTAPILTPAPLPPNPMPAFQPLYNAGATPLLPTDNCHSSYPGHRISHHSHKNARGGRKATHPAGHNSGNNSHLRLNLTFRSISIHGGKYRLNCSQCLKNGRRQNNNNNNNKAGIYHSRTHHLLSVCMHLQTTIGLRILPTRSHLKVTGTVFIC